VPLRNSLEIHQQVQGEVGEESIHFEVLASSSAAELPRCAAKSLRLKSEQ
jgi:hypothetical protein